MAVRQPKIVFTGESDWCSLLSAGLREHAGLATQVAAFDRASEALSLSRWARLASADMVVRIGFRPGARTWRGKGLDSAFRFLRTLHPGQHTVYYWIGTDVLKLLADLREGTSPGWLKRELEQAAHFSVAEPLSEELAEAGVRAEFMPFPFRGMPADDAVPPLPARFSVLSYIPDDKADFYGGPTILAAAQRLPDVQFKIMGGSGRGSADVPPNVEYLGFVSEPARLFVDTACLVRMTEHDGAGGTVLEALSYGRPAIYSRQQEGVIHVPFGDVEGLVAAVGELHKRHAEGELQADLAEAQRIRATYDPQRCYGHLAQRLLEIAGMS